MGSQKNVDMSQQETEIKHVKQQPVNQGQADDTAADDTAAEDKKSGAEEVSPKKDEGKKGKDKETAAKKAGAKKDKKGEEEADKTADKTDEETQEKTKPISLKPKHERSKKYKAVRSKVDRTKTYDPFSAIELVKKLSYTQFPGTISAHLTLKEQGLTKEIAFPHSTGLERNIEIASDKTLKKIEAGEIDFDVLLAAPDMMSKLTKHAPILGPQGLMPNPKNGTLTPNPKQRKKELESGKRMLKTERKAPLIHVAIGKTDMDTQHLIENLQVLIEAFQNKLEKVTIAATMSPGIKVSFETEE